MQQASISGTPDFLGNVAGRFVALELKSSARAKTTKLQQYNMTRIEQTGGIALVVYPENWHDVYEFLQKISLP